MRQALAGDVAQRLKDPGARSFVERAVLSKVQQAWHGRATLLRAEHPGLREATGGALADHGRRIVVEDVEQGRDRGIGCEIGKTLDRAEKLSRRAQSSAG